MFHRFAEGGTGSPRRIRIDISEHGGKGVVDLDFYFIETSPGLNRHRLNVALAAR